MPRSLTVTNILIYSRDLDAAEKWIEAIKLVDALAESGELVVSMQCLNEFSAASLRRGVAISQIEMAVARWL